jgi:hypothetical protein
MTVTDLQKNGTTVADLQKILRDVDEAAVLVSSRILERVIRENCKLPNIYWNIPHSRSFVCDRQVLFRHAEQADLDLEPDQVLPDQVILLNRPPAEELSNLERQVVLLKYWRLLFHARIHTALAARDLGDEAVRERIEQIGRTEFEEVKTVLIEDRYLPPDPDDRTTYIEFAAVYLELRYFAVHLLDHVFPGIRKEDRGKIERLLGRDLTGEANPSELFNRTRLDDNLNPVTTPETRSEESLEAYWKLVRAAQHAALSRNIVRAAILRMRASRIAPAAQTLSTRLEAEADLAALAGRLAVALGLDEMETGDWTRYLTLLLDKADQGTRPIEAKVLEDLQSVCLDHERETYTLDLVECVLSGGRRPIKRPLPSQRLVRITKHLRAAGQKLQQVRLSDNDRDHLSGLIHTALKKSEDSLRGKFRPVLRIALEDVGLKPTTPIERTAFDKMVDELLDRIIQYGFLTFSELRDTISRNQLKLPDVSEPEFFLRGDPLLRLDRRLGSLLDGVYRPGEFYVRALERATSLGFGTWWGRWATRYLLGPFLLAWLVLFMLGYLLDEVEGPFHLSAVKPVVEVLMGPAYSTKEGEMVGTAAYLAEHGTEPHREHLSLWWHFALLVPLGLFLLALLQNARFRERYLNALGMVWRCVLRLGGGVLSRIVPLAALRRLVDTWVFQLLYWYIIKPAACTLLLLFLWRDLSGAWFWIALVFFVVSVLINSRIGRGVSEGINDALVQFAAMVRSGLLGGLVSFTVQVFKQAIELLEYVLFSVDEGLRFRSGDGRVSLVVRTILGVLWYPVAFLARFYMVVLIEPGINPVKLPIALLAGKLMLPLYPFIYGTFQQPLSSAFGDRLAWAVIAFHLFWLPDVAAFLAWEIKENWSLYRANRSKVLEPVSVGSHGETVRGLLQPGFHSGRVPALFYRLRQAERKATRTRDWRRARAYRLEVEEVEESLHRFLVRNMVAMLKLSQCWRDQAVEAGPVHLATNRIHFELNHPGCSSSIQVEIEHHHTWLVACIRQPGWLEQLTAEQQRAFATCLAGLYKLAGVDLVREQLYSSLPALPAAARLTPEGLQVWWETHGEPESYPLRRRPQDPEQAALLDRLVFSRLSITWEQWLASWDSDQQGKGHPGLPGMTELVLPRSVLAKSEPPAPAAAMSPLNDSPPVAAGEMPADELAVTPRLNPARVIPRLEDGNPVSNTRE